LTDKLHEELMTSATEMTKVIN